MTDSDILQFPTEAAQTPPEQTVELLGPVEPDGHYMLVVGGYRVPYVRVYRSKESAQLALTVHREGWGIVPHMLLDEADLQGLAWFLAQAMAIAAGYHGFGKHSFPLNPFATRVQIQDEPEANANFVTPAGLTPVK